MTPKQHLARILRFWTRFITKKYLAGQKEHGGRLRYKRGLLAHCEQETGDLCAYLPTLRMQLEHVLRLLDMGHVGPARRDLEQILGPTVNKHLGEE